MRILALVGVLCLQACATSSELATARHQFRQGGAQAALETLTDANVSSRNELLLLLDRGLVAQAAQDYRLSVANLEEAFQLVEDLDYVSSRDQSLAVVSSDLAIRYRGESSERLWIHTFQMINFLMLDRPQEAAVEARRAVELFDENADVLDADVFTRYLMALSFAAAGQYDSASVEFRKLDIDVAPQALRAPSDGSKELILLLATGFIEPKQPGDIIVNINTRVAFPFYPEIHERPPLVKISADSLNLPITQVDTELVSISRNALAKRAKAIIARQALRLAAKYNIANEIGNQDELAGNIARVLLFLLERPDTRSWETLPSYLTLVRTEVPEDTHAVRVQVSSDSAYSRRPYVHSLELQLDETKRQFHLIRLGDWGDPGVDAYRGHDEHGHLASP